MDDIFLRPWWKQPKGERSERTNLVTGQADALQVALLIPATLRHWDDVVNLLRQRQSAFPLAGLAESEVSTQDAVPYLGPSVAGLVAEAPVAFHC